jgi:hypothetical protein
LDQVTVLDLFKQAVETRQIKISLHAAEEALVENITRPEIEAVLLTAEILEDYADC